MADIFLLYLKSQLDELGQKVLVEYEKQRNVPQLGPRSQISPRSASFASEAEVRVLPTHLNGDGKRHVMEAIVASEGESFQPSSSARSLNSEGPGRGRVPSPEAKGPREKKPTPPEPERYRPPSEQPERGRQLNGHHGQSSSANSSSSLLAAAQPAQPAAQPKGESPLPRQASPAPERSPRLVHGLSDIHEEGTSSTSPNDVEEKGSVAVVRHVAVDPSSLAVRRSQEDAELQELHPVWTDAPAARESVKRQGHLDEFGIEQRGKFRRQHSGDTIQTLRSSNVGTSNGASHEQVKRVGFGNSETLDQYEGLAAMNEAPSAPVQLRMSDESPSTPSNIFRRTVRKASLMSATGGASHSSTGNPDADQCFSPSYVILPTAFWYRTWCHFISVLVLISLFLTPMRFGFDPSWDFDFVVRTWDYFFAADILLTFNVGVLTKRGLMLQRWRIFKHLILSRNFWLDVVAIVPFDTIWAAMSEAPRESDSRKITRALGMVRMFRVNRLLLVFRDLQKSTYFNLLIVVVMKFVVFILLCTHTSGCVFYALSSYAGHGEGTWVSEVDPDLPGEDLVTRYVRVLFWAVATFKAGPVSGLLGPYSNSEMLLACLTMMMNICLQTYLVSNMAALLTTADTRIYAMRNQLRQLEDFSHRYNLPLELRHQLRKCIRFKFVSDQELDQNVLSGMPELYRQRISHVLFEEILLGVDLFKDCANLFLRQLHGRLKSTLYMPDEKLVNIDEPAGQLQIIGEGEVEVRDRHGNIVTFASRGEVISALSFLCKVGQPFTVRTRTTCRILTIDHANWDAVCQAFPENLHLVTNNLLHQCEQKATENIVGRSGHTTYMEMAQIVRDHMVQKRETSLALFIAAAARGDVAEIKRMLNSTVPNVMNYDARTPLHLAASNGHTEAITLLLEADADVDPMDNFGRTPLLEACRGNKRKAAQMLFNAGATLGREEGDEQVEGPEKHQSKEALDSMAAGEMCTAASDIEQLWYLKMLLRYGADPNVGDYDKRTALHVACACGNKPAVEFLVGFKGINLDPRDNFGRTPLMEAVRHNHEHVARVLKSRGAFHGFITDLKNMQPNSIPAGQELCQAAFSNQMQYLHNLMAFCDLDVDACDYDLRTALMLACAEGNMAIAVHLVQVGADINRKDRWGHTALSEARQHGNHELANVLVQIVKSRGVLEPS